MAIPQLDPQEADQFLKSHPDAKLVDVRTDEEYRIARIPGALLINTHEKADEILGLPKDTPLIFHCHHGMRSQQAAGYFFKKGFTNVYNLAGGIDAWSQDVDSKIPRY